MNYNTVYVGMDVHKESFTLCSCKYEDEKASHYQRTPASYKNVLRYLAFLRTIYGEDTRFVCVATKRDALGILCIINWKILMWNV